MANLPKKGNNANSVITSGDLKKQIIALTAEYELRLENEDSKRLECLFISIQHLTASFEALSIYEKANP